MLYYYSDGQFRQILKELLLSHEVVLCCSMGKRGQQDLLDFDYIDMYVPSTLDTLYTTASHRTQPLQSPMARVAAGRVRAGIFSPHLRAGPNFSARTRGPGLDFWLGPDPNSALKGPPA